MMKAAETSYEISIKNNLQDQVNLIEYELYELSKRQDEP
jgi:hypothetical protein